MIDWLRDWFSKKPAAEPMPDWKAPVVKPSPAYAAAENALLLFEDWELTGGGYYLQSRKANTRFWVANAGYGLAMGEAQFGIFDGTCPVRFSRQEADNLWRLCEQRILECIERKSEPQEEGMAK